MVQNEYNDLTPGAQSGENPQGQGSDAPPAPLNHETGSTCAEANGGGEQSAGAGQSTGQPMIQPMGQPGGYGEPQVGMEGCSCGGQPSEGYGAPQAGQPMGGPMGQPMGQPTGQPTGQPMAGPMGQPAGQPMTGPMGQPMGQPAGQPMGQPMGQPTGQPMAGPGGYGEPQLGMESCSCGDQPSEGYGGPQMGQPGYTYGGPPMSQPSPTGLFMGQPTGQPGPTGHPGAMGYPGAGGPPMGGFQPGGPVPHVCNHGGAQYGPPPGPAYGPVPGYGFQPSFAPGGGPVGQAQQVEAQMGQMMDLFTEMMDGGKPDMSKVAGLLGTFDGAFWKGALVGAGLALLVSSPTVTGAISGLFSGLTGGDGSSKTDAPTAGEEA